MKPNVVVSLLLLLVSTATCCPPSDLRALLVFRSSLHEPYLGIFNSWTGQDCCHDWYGVSCDAVTHRVADINLRGESEDPIFERARRTGYMTGRISPAICDLARLSAVTIANWKGISGDIPGCITRLSFLRTIDLVGNQLSGSIPNDIGWLNRLAVLNVADNRISGSIPKLLTNLSSLMHLDLRNNIRTCLIPTDFGRLTMLSRELLSGNRITGLIPESLTKIYRSADVDLSGNQLYGTIPPSLGCMSVLATLNLDGNRISGEIPQTLMTSSVMNLSRNSLQGKIKHAPPELCSDLCSSEELRLGPPKGVPIERDGGRFAIVPNQIRLTLFRFSTLLLLFLEFEPFGLFLLFLSLCKILK